MLEPESVQPVRSRYHPDSGKRSAPMRIPEGSGLFVEFSRSSARVHLVGAFATAALEPWGSQFLGHGKGA